jgi:hypothetical protein
MGECEFDDDGQRLEVISEHGMIPPGTKVKVVSIVNGRPAVRVIAREEDSSEYRPEQ